MSTPARAERTNWIVYVVASLYLVFQALWRLFARAGEWPPKGIALFEIGLDVAMSGAVIALYFKISRQSSTDASRQTMLGLLLIVALVAIATIFIIRFSSDVGWWTGHRRNWND